MDAKQAYSHRTVMDIDKLRLSGIKVTTITDTIHVIQGNNRSRSPFSNAILILDKTHALIDPGCGTEITQKIARTIGIDIVITSHSHPDHTAGVHLIQEISNPHVAVPQEHAQSIYSADSLALRFVDKDMVQLWKDYYLPITGFRDFTPTMCFAHGHEFSFGENRFIALHTPGHLEDHYCLFEPDQKIVAGFDIDLSPFGPWYGNPESDIDQFKESIDLVSRLDAEIYITSHSKPVKDAYISKRMDTYTKAFHERDDTILRAMSMNNWSDLEDIVMQSPIYQVDHSRPDRLLIYGETQMVLKHIQGLAEKGRIIHQDGKYRRAY